MRLHFRNFVSAFVLACVAPSVSAQPPAASDDEIVVEGVRERQRQIQRFVDALTDAPVGGQIARFDWEVCPVAVGLTEAQNAEITARMRRIASASGVPLARAGCRGNAVLIATPDKARTLRWMREEYPHHFRDALGHRVPLIDEDGPATAWQVEGRLDQDGQMVGAETGARDSSTANHYVIKASRDPSRLTPQTRPHFMGSFLVVQTDALRGLSTVQVADYAAMRLFARTQPSRLARSGAPTILNVIDAPMNAAVPLSLTQWDLGFLRALYGSTENQYATRQRGQMRRLLRSDLEEAQDGRDE